MPLIAVEKDLRSLTSVYVIILKYEILIDFQVGRVSILVNNAGIVSGSALLDTPDGRLISTISKFKKFKSKRLIKN